jgi:hypothetical protein
VTPTRTDEPRDRSHPAAPASFSGITLRVDRREIGYVRFIIEGCDGLAVMTTVDRSAGWVRLSVAAGREAEVERLLADLAGEEGILIERGPAPS